MAQTYITHEEGKVTGIAQIYSANCEVTPGPAPTAMVSPSVQVAIGHFVRQSPTGVMEFSAKEFPAPIEAPPEVVVASAEPSTPATDVDTPTAE